MRVLMLPVRFYPFGDGPERQALSLSRTLRARGVDVAVATVARAHETAYDIGTNRPHEIELRSNRAGLETWEGLRRSHHAFVPPRGWEGHLELEPEPQHRGSQAAPPTDGEQLAASVERHL